MNIKINYFFYFFPNLDVPFFTSNLIRTSYKMSNYESHIADMQRYLQSNNVGRIVSTPANQSIGIGNTTNNSNQRSQMVPINVAAEQNQVPPFGFFNSSVLPSQASQVGSYNISPAQSPSFVNTNATFGSNQVSLNPSNFQQFGYDGHQTQGLPPIGRNTIGPSPQMSLNSFSTPQRQGSGTARYNPYSTIRMNTPNPPNPLSSIQFQARPARLPSRGRNSQREQQPKIEFFTFLILNSYFENLKDIPEECIHGFRIGFDRNDDGNSRLETLFNNAPFLSENPFVFLKKTRTALAPALFCSNEGLSRQFMRTVQDTNSNIYIRYFLF